MDDDDVDRLVEAEVQALFDTHGQYVASEEIPFLAAVTVNFSLQERLHSVNEWKMHPELIYVDLSMVYKLLQACIDYGSHTTGCTGTSISLPHVPFAMAAAYSFDDLAIYLRAVAGIIKQPIDWRIVRQLGEVVRQVITTDSTDNSMRLHDLCRHFEREMKCLSVFASLFKHGDTFNYTRLPQRSHSELFDSVVWDGQPHTFTPPQAKVVALLWKAWERGGQSVLTVDLLEAAESDGTRLRDVFRPGGTQHAAWGTMIVRDGKGHYRLSSVVSAESR